MHLQYAAQTADMQEQSIERLPEDFLKKEDLHINECLNTQKELLWVALWNKADLPNWEERPKTHELQFETTTKENMLANKTLYNRRERITGARWQQVLEQGMPTMCIPMKGNKEGLQANMAR